MKKTLWVFLILVIHLPFFLLGCGGGGGGGGGSVSGSGAPFGTADLAVLGQVNTVAANGAPERLEAPLAGYTVRANNAVTGETIPGAIATTDNNGNFVLTLRVSVIADSSIVIVARDPNDFIGITVMRTILPLVASNLQTLINEGKTSITIGQISPDSELTVQSVEQALAGISNVVFPGSLGLMATDLDTAQINTEAMRDNRFVLVGVSLAIYGEVTGTPGGGLPPPPPLTVDMGQSQEQAAFGNVVNLGVNVGNVPADAQVAYSWTQVSGMPVTLTGTNTTNPSFTTVSTTEAMAYLKSKFTGNPAPARFGIKAFSALNVSDLSYTFKMTATAGDRTGTGTIAVSTLNPSSGLPNQGVGTVVILEGLEQASYNWSMTFTPQNLGEASSSQLKYADTRYPVFMPDKTGTYTITEATSGKSLNVYAGTWAGGDLTSLNCNVCHDASAGWAPQLAPYFVAWANTSHAKTFSSQIDGTRGSSFQVSCLKCHSVGYNTASQAVNDGFDDPWNNPPAGKTPWQFPATLKAGNWQSMTAAYPELATRANVRCENCHGPNTSPAHTTISKTPSARVSMNSEICAVCHGAGGPYGKYQDWQQSGHGNYALTARGVNNSSCGRCHAGQGFINWIAQAEAGKPGAIIDPGTNKDAAAGYLTSLGMGSDTVVPQTCQTCHDPHNSVENPHQLRIYNDTPMLPSGFQAFGVGKGAICMTCHNTRNGVSRVKNADGTVVQDVLYLHEDDDPVGSVPTAYTAPHVAAQADVFMGHNAYFVNGINISKHASIEDTCVQCHMTLVPAYTNPTTNISSGTNHLFRVTPEQVCSKCHGPGVTGTALKAQVEASIEELGNANAQYLMAKMQRVSKDTSNITWINIQGYPITDPATGTIFDSLTPPTDIDLSNIDRVFPIEPHGQQGFVFVFKTPVTFTYNGVSGVPDGTTKTVTEIEVRLGDIKQYSDPNNKTGTRTVIIPLSDPLVKAGWNYFLLHGDGTKGMHNPGFYLKVLSATITAMQDAVKALP